MRRVVVAEALRLAGLPACHVPHCLACHRQREEAAEVVLLALDGMKKSTDSEPVEGEAT